jgi:hypothetical protein
MRDVKTQLHRAFGAIDVLPARTVRAQETLGQFRFGNFDGCGDAHVAKITRSGTGSRHESASSLAFTRHREAISGLRMQDRKRGTPQTARRRSALIAE